MNPHHKAALAALQILADKAGEVVGHVVVPALYLGMASVACGIIISWYLVWLYEGKAKGG